MRNLSQLIGSTYLEKFQIFEYLPLFCFLDCIAIHEISTPFQYLDISLVLFSKIVQDVHIINNRQCHSHCICF